MRLEAVESREPWRSPRWSEGLLGSLARASELILVASEWVVSGFWVGGAWNLLCWWTLGFWMGCKPSWMSGWMPDELPVLRACWRGPACILSVRSVHSKLALGACQDSELGLVAVSVGSEGVLDGPRIKPTRWPTRVLNGPPTFSMNEYMPTF